MQCGEVLVCLGFLVVLKKLFWTWWKSKISLSPEIKSQFFPFVQKVVWPLFRATELLNSM
jgi:hypothetical protein